jgi:hypothetical protein
MKDCRFGVKVDLTSSLRHGFTIPAGMNGMSIKQIRPTGNSAGRKRRNTDDEY